AVRARAASPRSSCSPAGRPTARRCSCLPLPRCVGGQRPYGTDPVVLPPVVVDHLEELVDALLPAQIGGVLGEAAAHGAVVLDLDEMEDVAAVAPDPPGVHARGAQRGIEIVGDAGVLALVVLLVALGDPGVQGDVLHERSPRRG